MLMSPLPGGLTGRLAERMAAIQSCAPADRATAEEGIHLAYRAAGLPPPQRIVWCGGPIEIARKLAAVTPQDAVGASVKALIYDQARDRIAELAEKSQPVAMEAAGRIRMRGTLTALQIAEAVQAAADDILFSFALRARHAFDVWRGATRWLPDDTFLDVAIGPDELGGLAVYEYLHEVEGWEEAQPLRGLWTVATSASWIVPYANVCWIAERPEVLQSDARGRLHSADGPALRYRDGWSYFAWKGTKVPAWMIEHPERITADIIGDEIDPALRNTMIDIMTPERFVASGDPSCISRDATGALWRRNWTYRGVTIGSWAAVEVDDGEAGDGASHRREFVCVPPDVRTPREAIAWAYGRSRAD
jgi:uncharacterized protein DUF6745